MPYERALEPRRVSLPIEIYTIEKIELLCVSEWRLTDVRVTCVFEKE